MLMRLVIVILLLVTLNVLLKELVGRGCKAFSILNCLWILVG